ncbi:Hpt domain-containing protein [Oligoflexus tunisiensis]|uniref:Hpt domain-containing protein n=1 Tax=Oligoflexus tunisiensis TaxID=708132 RepID=UPI000AD00BB8|nr:Hpt domain-containing protein [Oligoflexus tunisiensis]
MRSTRKLIFALLSCFLWGGLLVAESRENCFSCDIKVRSLKRPLDLRGRWLFTREDLPQNKDPETDTSSWITIDAPGTWNNAYEDGETFEVGWYRGNFRFHSRLIGKKAVFYVDAYMSRLQIFLDGKEIMSRKGRHTHEQYHSIQPIPVVFEITETRHVITMRVDTRLMMGVYQLPFQLRPYREFDPVITFYQLFAGELRNISAYVLLVFGLFFLAVYARTRYALYLAAGLTGIGIFPFYAFPHDNMIKLVDPEKLWILHYIGINCLALGHVTYSQYFWKATPRINRINFIVVAALAGLLVAMTFNFNMFIFQIVRKVTFLYSFWMAMHLVWNCWHAFRANSRLFILLLGEATFFVCSVHDILLALGLIHSTSLIFLGTLISTTSILYLTAVIFAETYTQNRQLLMHVGEVNQNLERTVAARTHDLYEKKQNLSLILQSLPEGIMAFDASFRILPEYSLALERILETGNIEGRDIFQLLFAHSSVPMDVQAQMRSVLALSFDEPVLNFDINSDLLVKEFQASIRGSIKVLGLTWSAVMAENNQITRVLLTISDVTQVKRLERESQRAKLRSKIVEAVLNGSVPRIQDFVVGAQNALRPYVEAMKVGQLTDEQITGLYREVHTIKGNARTFDLQDLADNAHQVEKEFEELKRRSENMESEQIVFILQDLLDTLHHIENVETDVVARLSRAEQQTEHNVHPRLWRMFKNRWEHLSPEHAALELPELQQDIQMMSYRQAQPYFADLVHGFDEIAAQLNKPAPTIHFDIPNELFMDAALAKAVNDILVHMIRNSLDHGIETPELRRQANKPERGQVTITFRPQGRGFILDYVDDGCGLNLEKIRNRAMQLGLREALAQDPEQLVQSIFMHGFSTAEDVSEVSGRGVGMEVVARELRTWKARLRWNQMAQAYTEAQLLPFDISILFPSGSVVASGSGHEVRIAL